MNKPDRPILSVEGLSVSISGEGGQRSLVSDVSFEVRKGEVFGLIGQSGSGKTVTCNAVAGLLPDSLNARIQGRALLKGKDLFALGARQRREALGLDIGVIFQDPLSSLNPSVRIGRQISETLRIRRNAGAAEAETAAVRLLTEVGIKEPAEVAKKYPHELSGGMRQRVMIAIAISCQPSLLIADEPTTALDPTVQRQVLDLITELARKHELGVLLITHNIGVVAQYADQVGVMLNGSLVERGKTKDVLGAPDHPYTAGLIRSAVTLDNYAERRRTLTSGGNVGA